MKLKIAKNETIETDNIAIGELNQLHQHLCEQADAMALRLANAKANVITNGEYSDPNWYNRLIFALKQTRRTVEALREVIAERKRAERAALAAQNPESQPTLAWVFMELCRENMDPIVFETLRADAKVRLKKLKVGWDDE